LLDDHGSDGQRWLGALVGDIILRGDRRPPPALLLQLAATAAGCFVGLRLIGTRRRATVAAALAMLALITLCFTTAVWMINYALLALSLASAGWAGVLLLDRGARWAVRQLPSRVPSRAVYAGQIAGLCAIGLAVRLAAVPTPDLVGDQKAFAAWGVWLLTNGLQGFYNKGMDYPPLWPYALQAIAGIAAALKLRFVSPLPVASALLLKLPAILADLALTLVLYRHIRERRGPTLALLAACAFTLLPPIWIDSASWGQVDSMPALVLVLILLNWERADGLVSWGLFACALLLKAQMVVFAPLMVVATLRERGVRGLLRGSAVAGAVALLICAPLLAAGQAAQLIDVYILSVGRFPRVTINAYNLWYLLTLGAGNYDPALGKQQGILDNRIWLAGLTYHTAGLLLMAALALCVCALLIRRSDGETRLIAALLLAVGFFTLPTQIHERYLFPAFPLLMLWLARDKVARWPLLLLALASTVNLLRVAPFIPPLYALLSPAIVPLITSALDVAVLIWLALRAYRSVGRPATT
jgi:Gpi18-like mannosyltransferase